MYQECALIFNSTWSSSAHLITLANITLLPVLYTLYYTANGQKAAKAV